MKFPSHYIERAGLRRYIILGGDGEARAPGWRGRCACNLFLHRIDQGDAGIDEHNHPYGWSVSAILWHGYDEQRDGKRRRLYPGMLNVIFANTYHRIDLRNNLPAWTLFLTGPKVQTWGMRGTAGYTNMSGT